MFSVFLLWLLSILFPSPYHRVIFAHRAIIQFISDIESHAVATGLCEKLGNKGGIAVALKVGQTKFCFLTAHLAAHQNQMDRRSAEFARISREVVHALGPEKKCLENEQILGTTSRSDADEVETKDFSKEDSLTEGKSEHSSASSDRNVCPSCCFCPKGPHSSRKCNLCCRSDMNDLNYNPLPNAFDHVIWGGDLNFRIHGTRDIVDSLLAQNRHDVLKDNDQLNMLMQFHKTFSGFVEGPLSFRPTYKFDKQSG